jgi:xanthine dehydrogenase YagR molybdenum-binding subunit
LARCAVQDMGTGSRTVIATAVREAFEGVDVDVEVGHGDGPHGPMSGGSRTTPSIAPAAMAAASALQEKLRERLGGSAADAQGVRTAAGLRPWPDVLAACDGEQVTGERGRDRHGFLVPGLSMNHMRIGRGMSGAVHVTEVEVDTLLGTTRVLRAWSGLSVGRIWAPRLARNQAEGSVIQGVGFALYEQRQHDPNTGEILTANLEDYRIPGIGDTPEIDVYFHERGWEHVPGGGIGLGEVATIAVAASVGNAVHHATGWRPTELPIRPDRLLEGLGQ